MKDRVVTVTENTRIGDGIYRMTLDCGDIGEIRGGQFVNIALPDSAHILRRPFCICDYDAERNSVTVVYAVVGEGTRLLSAVAAGSKLKALFPLGNGFDMKESYRKVMLVGGGLGSAVMPAVPTTWADREYYTFLGFASESKICCYDMLEKKSREIYVSTDDGSYGHKGFVTDIVREKIGAIDPDAILVCGPEPLYRALLKAIPEYSDRIYVSLEKRMGCGIGACLVCNCKIKTADGAKYLRACADGPVFKLNEVMLDE